ncbi:hypothetical protein QYE76_045560 [Lolium multiflorum]|uniref:DUF7597 domain-containing protein n=1 Tax=Lolium multiflorum TaxID=4521 RepID=A0AAD8TN64_LOLMU|nr:hypothetical protein QYE76_045560 [Lolium multiflorum]
MGMNAMRAAGVTKSAVRRNPTSTGRRLRFAVIENYTACKGYRYPMTAEQIQDLTDGGYDLSSPEKIPASPAPAVFWTNAEPSIQFMPAQPLVQAVKDCSGYVTVSEPAIQFTTVHPLSSDVPSVQQSDASVILEQGSVLDQPPASVLNLVPDDSVGGLISSSGPDLSSDGLQEFEAMIDEMVYKVWECGRCLSMGHKTYECTNEIRCKACFSYGHIAKKCLTEKRKKTQVWVPKTASAATGLLDSRDSPPLSSSVVSPRRSPQESTQFSTPSTSSSYPPISLGGAASPGMAVYELDPMPWLPLGHEIIDGGPTRLPRTFYTPPEMPQRRHDNLCIAYIAPPQPEGDAFWRDQVRLFGG